MQQSSTIAGALFIAFVVFITIRGELPSYINVLLGPSPASGPVAPAEHPAAPQTGFWDSLLGGLPLIGGIIGGAVGGGSGSTPADPTIPTGPATQITFGGGG